LSLVEPGVTGRKAISDRKRKKKSQKHPSEQGTHAYSVPQAGRMIGLSRGASYAAAKVGQIPTERFGDRLIVPKAVWDRKLGIES
jgi:hypothetical protein